MEAGLPTSRRRWWGRVKLGRKWRTGCLPQGNKAQGPPERTSGKSSGGFHANVIHSENGSLLGVGKDKTKNTDALQCLRKPGTSQIF